MLKQIKRLRVKNGRFLLKYKINLWNSKIQITKNEEILLLGKWLKETGNALNVR